MRGQEGLRAAAYHRLHFLLPFAAGRAGRALWRALVWGFWIVYFGFILLVLALRYAILPRIEDYRPAIERLVSERMGQSVAIGRIEARWQGLRPDLSLIDVHVADAEGRPALALSRVEAVLSWWSVPSAQLRLRLLHIDAPTLHLRRDAAGRFFVAGIPLDREQGDSDLSGWILEQRRIRITGATVNWEDELRQAPALLLKDVDLAIDNRGRRHLFGLSALPPPELASRLDIRGDLRGRDLNHLASWSGQVYAEFDRADLAVWQQWIDYPLELPRGSGAVRLWGEFGDGGLREITADVALQEVRLCLREDLPELELESMRGRLSGRFTDRGFEASGRGVELVTPKTEAAPPIRIEPTNFRLVWEAEGNERSGSAAADRLDIGALASLGDHLPLPAASRQWLQEHAPRGRIRALGARWQGSAERLQTYALNARFEDLSLKAHGAVPGFTGLTGSLDATEKGGALALETAKSAFDLPAVFPEAQIALDSLQAAAKWKFSKGELEAELQRAEFAGPDAAGSARGSYRTAAGGPGIIDMTAELTRADGRAVWRYLPHAVGQSGRHWLRDSLLAGKASEARLTLNGNLADFPFLDKRKGQFLVTVKAQDAVIDYGKDWPRIEDIRGDLRFEGNGMVVEAQSGRILGARLSDTRVEIPDFDKPISTLLVRGKADGPTSEFLRFIDRSPVAERIDRFTEDMRAKGNGHLDIDLTIPLAEAKLGDSKIDGRYRFSNNEVTVDPALPPLQQVNGSVRFSGSDLSVPGINATLFGGPLTIKGGLQKDGRILITAAGTANVMQLRRQSDHPLLAHVSGSAAYRGEVRIDKRNADVVIESGLAGLSSALPEPFNKPAAATLPLRFEKKLLPVAGGAIRDQISATLGDVMSMRLIRRRQAGGFAVERGAIAIGRPLELPAAGVLLGVSVPRLDVDEWRNLLRKENGNGAAAAGAADVSPPLINAVNLKAADLALLGRHFTDVDLTATAAVGGWQLRLDSRQASGELRWEEEGSGKLTARLRQLKIDHAPNPVAEEAIASEPTEKLPAIDFVVDDFLLEGRRFGRVEVQARNEAGVWQLKNVHVSNPAAILTGSGQWRPGAGRTRTRLVFKLDASDVGKLLDRLGYEKAVRGGTAEFDGRIDWSGSPIDLDLATLSGELHLQAERGQFVKVDPGAAGRLLALISLQSLPRRITLDFKDVFSEGLAFDSIASKLAIHEGVMRTDSLLIDGPSARVVMRGEVDLKRETQHLNVSVQPELGGTAALGVAIVNPVAGVATLLAQKVLRNPLNQMFGVDYLVTGTWDDPKVEKVAVRAPASPP